MNGHNRSICSLRYGQPVEAVTRIKSAIRPPAITSARMAAATPRLTEGTFDLLAALHRIGDQVGAPVAAVALAWVWQ